VRAAAFDASQAADDLYKAMKGFGTNENTIISVLSHCSTAQRKEIEIAFQSKYSKDLLAELRSELSGDFEKLVVCLFTPAVELSSSELHRRIEKQDALAVTEAITLIEDLAAVRGVYESQHGSLADAVAGAVSGPLQSVLAAWCAGAREVAGTVDEGEATNVAQRIADEGSAILGDDSLFMTTLTVVSSTQFAALSKAYAKLKGQSLSAAVNDLGSELDAKLIGLIETSAQNSAAATADAINRSVKGLGTDDTSLMWLIVTQSESDLLTVAAEYPKRHGESLSDAIKCDTSGDYQSLLLHLLSP